MKATAFGHIFKLLEPYKLQVALSLFLVLLPGYFTVWMPYVIGRFVDDGLIGKDASIVVSLGLLILSLKILLFFVNWLVTYCLSSFGLQILVDYRSQLLSQILKYPMSFYNKISSGTLTTRLTSDVNSVQELFSTALIPILGNAFMIVAVFVAMFSLNWKLTLVASFTIPLLVWLNLAFDVRIRRRFGFVRKTMSAINAYGSESFSGQREIRSLPSTEAVVSEFESLSRRMKDRNIMAAREFALFNPSVPFITALMDILILGFGGYQIIQGQSSVGQVVAFLGYSALFSWPIRDFAEKYTVLQQALAAVDRLVEVSQNEPESDTGLLELPEAPHIQFENLSFKYEGSEQWALRNIYFEAKAGSRVALLGETGSGKTTTCNLMMRFYEAQEGRILINGRPIQDYSLESLRSQIGWVSQDVILFSRSLRDNISFYSKMADEEILAIIERVGLKDWFQKLPQGLDTLLTERASLLSSGQKQLLSLARALAQKPKILIFDEATASIDTMTEWKLQKALESLWRSHEFKNLSCFFIAHRLSTLEHCDEMLVFRRGEIVEKGRFEDLMKLNGYTAELYRQYFRRLSA